MKHFEFADSPPKLPVTTFNIPKKGLFVKYQHPSKGPADPSDIASEAAKFMGALGAGFAAGAFVGAIIGKVFLGSTLVRIGVATAGVGIGVPLLAPFAIAGGTLATVGYAAYKLGKGKHQQELAKALAEDLTKHMEEFNPSVPWPSIEVYVSVPEKGLAALWQPQSNDETD